MEQERTRDSIKCPACLGTGKYYGKGHVENGRFIGYIGDCYRCGGKGRQTMADVQRNTAYDMRRSTNE